MDLKPFYLGTDWFQVVLDWFQVLEKCLLQSDRVVNFERLKSIPECPANSIAPANSRRAPRNPQWALPLS